MQRLNIPLQSRSRTTRRLKRRVVWLLLFLSVVFFSFFWILARNWLTNDTVSKAAPESTVLMLRFTPNKQTWKDLSELLGDFPLISNRGITINDIQECTEGEFALFIQEDGTRSLAIHSSNSKLPRNLFDSHHITIQNISTDVFLLSEKLMPVSGLIKKANYQFDFIHFGYKKIGTAYFSIENAYVSGPLLLSNNNLQITLPSANIFPFNFNMAPENVLAVLSTPVWPTSNFSLPSYDIMSMWTQEKSSQIDTFIDSLANQHGTMMLASQEDHLQFLFSTNQDDIESEALLQSFKTLASLQNPQQITWKLDDGTLLQELVIDPSSIALEMITVSGNPVYRFPISDNHYLYFSEAEHVLTFSNDESLLRFWFTKELNNSSSNINLPENALYLDLKSFSKIFTQSSTYKQSSSLFQLQKIFSTVGIESKKHSLSLVFHRN